jgi:MFS family permease
MGMTLALLLMGPFMAQADATIANVATPSIRDDLGASGAALELVVGGYMIAFAVLLITGARLGQTHGTGAFSCSAWRRSPSHPRSAAWLPRLQCSSPRASSRAPARR